MASIAKKCFFLFFLTLTFSLQIHARESQFFNKVTSTNGQTEVVVPNTEETVKNQQEQQQQEPNFIPENENTGYGLYGHETGQLPPSTATTTTTNPTTTNVPYSGESKESHPKYLPKNYNTESYVTVAEGYRGEFDNNKNPNFYNSDNSYYNNNNQEEQNFGETQLKDKSYSTNPTNNGNEFYYNNNEEQNFGETQLAGKSYGTNPSNNGNEFYYNNNYGGGSNSYYNGEQEGMSDTRFNGNSYYQGEQQGLSDTRLYSTNPSNNRNFYNHNVGDLNAIQKQGMSDTRFLENGKYFHDINMDQNFNRGPYESTNNRGLYGNPQNSYEFNNYQNQNQEQFQNFQDEEDLP